MTNIERHVRDFRAILIQQGAPLPAEYEPPASHADLSLLADAIGRPVPEDLRELWGVSASGCWSFSQSLTSPVQSIEMSLLWAEILSEWSPDAESQLRFGEEVIALSSWVHGEILYLLDGPDAGAIGWFDSQNARHPWRLGRSLDHYLSSVVKLTSDGFLTVATVQFPDGRGFTEPAWLGDPGSDFKVPLQIQQDLDIGPHFL